MNYYQTKLFLGKPTKLRVRKDRLLPISIITKIQNNTMKYYYGRWKKHKKIHVVCDVVVNFNIYSLCGIAKKTIPVVESNKQEIKCTVCEKIYEEIQARNVN